MNNSKIWDCIVVGAGISGVSFAHQLKLQHREVLVLEKEHSVGGRMCTKVSSQYPDYLRELGSHTCYNSYSQLIALAKSAGLGEQLQAIDKGSYLIYNNQQQIVSISSQLSFVGLILHGFNLFRQKRDNKTVKEYFSPIVGEKNYDNLFTYLFRAVICQFPDNYPVSLFMKKRKEKDQTINRKFSFKGGMAQLTQTVLEYGKIDTLKETEVLSIDRLTSDGYYIVKSNKGDFNTRNIALACDPSTASALLTNIDKPISTLLTKIKLSSLFSTNVLISKEKINLKKIAGIINTGDLFLSAVTGDLLAERDLRTFSFHFASDEIATERIKKICKVLAIQSDDILDIQHADHVLPTLTVADLAIIQDLKEMLQNKKDIYILGNYFYGLSLEDCVRRSQDEFTRFLKALH